MRNRPRGPRNMPKTGKLDVCGRAAGGRVRRYVHAVPKNAAEASA